MSATDSGSDCWLGASSKWNGITVKTPLACPKISESLPTWCRSWPSHATTQALQKGSPAVGDSLNIHTIVVLHRTNESRTPVCLNNLSYNEHFDMGAGFTTERLAHTPTRALLQRWCPKSCGATQCSDRLEDIRGTKPALCMYLSEHS